MKALTLTTRARHVPAGCTVKFSRYTSDNSPALMLLMPNGERAAVASVCLDAPPPDGHVWLKGWSENDGIPEALQQSGVVELTQRFQRTGYALAQLAKLTPAAIAQLNEEHPL